MDLAAPAGRAVSEILATAGAAGGLLIVLDVSAVCTVLQQELVFSQAAPEGRGVGVRCRKRLVGGVCGGNHSVFPVPRMVVALVANPAPRLCTSPSSAPLTWRSPHSPRNCATTS